MEKKKKKVIKKWREVYALYPCVLVLVMVGAATMAAPQECCFYANTLGVEVRVGA